MTPAVLSSLRAADQALVDAVALAMCREIRPETPLSELHSLNRNWYAIARAAIAAVHEHETCSRCGVPLVPPTLCADCAADATPSITTDRRKPR